VRHRRHRTHRVVRHVPYRTTRHVVVRRSVRALCNDGRIHIGRTRASACAAHGGLR
jgi:hypothetical protein